MTTVKTLAAGGPVHVFFVSLSQNTTGSVPPEQGLKPVTDRLIVSPTQAACGEGVTVNPAARIGPADRTTVTRAAARTASPLPRCLCDSIAITAVRDHTYTERASTAQIQDEFGVYLD
jgi:hypothetical protein